MQRVWNVMFTWNIIIEPVHLAILTHLRHKNIHNNIDNNNNSTQFLLHIHTQNCISSLYSNRSGIICNNFVSYSQGNICNSKGDSVQELFITGRRYAEKLSANGFDNLGLSLPSISLDLHHSQIRQNEILDWPHILIPLKDNLSSGWIRLITVGQLPIKVEWLDAPLAVEDFSCSNILWYLCQYVSLIYSLAYITEPVFLPFLNANSAQKWKKTKIYKSE